MKLNNIITFIVGARPNFIKLAPLAREFKKKKVPFQIINTGQHRDYLVSKIFFDQFGIKQFFNLNIKSKSSNELISKTIIKLEKIFTKIKPPLLVVFGDVNSTLAASIAAKNMNIKLAHIESGLRSFDKKMPEEINRILTDHLSDIKFYTENSAKVNLKKENILENSYFVGNVMIDNLVYFKPKALKKKTYLKYNLEKKKYIYVSLHRPENVDNREKLNKILINIDKLSKSYKVIFPIHHRTKKSIGKFKLKKLIKNIIDINPQSYLDNLNLIINAKGVVTDSGGIQEETAFLNIPCAVLRKNTERPVTLKRINAQLINENNINNSLKKLITRKSNLKIKYWDGKTSKRIINYLDILRKKKNF